MHARVEAAAHRRLGYPFRSELIAVFVQYHLYSKPSVGVFARAGIRRRAEQLVLHGQRGRARRGGGLGVEIGLSHGHFLTPELFYKDISLSPSNGSGHGTGEQVVGLQLSLTFY